MLGKDRRIDLVPNVTDVLKIRIDFLFLLICSAFMPFYVAKIPFNSICSAISSTKLGILHLGGEGIPLLFLP